jgi:hypothetical protein
VTKSHSQVGTTQSYFSCLEDQDPLCEAIFRLNYVILNLPWEEGLGFSSGWNPKSKKAAFVIHHWCWSILFDILIISVKVQIPEKGGDQAKAE